MTMLKFCSCRQCRGGRHTTQAQIIIKRAKRRLRRQCKVDLRKGRVPESKISVPHTD